MDFLSHPTTPLFVRLLGVRPADADHTYLRHEWLVQACSRLGDHAFRIFGYLASIASEPGCDLSPAPEDVAQRFHMRLRETRRGYHELRAAGVLRDVPGGYELMDQWGYFA